MRKDGCKTGTFNQHNSTDCSGDVTNTVQKDTCTTFGPSTGGGRGMYRCSSYDDAEYLRNRKFFHADGHFASECNSTLTIDTFVRLDFCYSGGSAGSLGFKYEKVNASAWRAIVFNDAACTSVNNTQEGGADGTCQGTFLRDFVSGSSLDSSAITAGKSGGLMVAALLGAVLWL